MNSIIGHLQWDGSSARALDGVLGHGTRVARVGNASVAARGPLASIASGDTWLCGISGRIDNHAHLAARLGEDTINVESVASVIGMLIDRDGFDAIHQLRGVFAGVFTDGDRIWWFRDQMGFWPLFHSTVAGQFVTSDSIRACTTATGQPYRVNTPYLDDFFYGRIGSSTATAVRGVMRSRAGSWGQAGIHGNEMQQYWDPSGLVELDPPPKTEIAAIFETLMAQAVDRVMTGTDALSLSGGVDSPVLAAYAAPQYQARYGRALPAVSAIYPDFPSVDEEDLIRLVADDLEMPLHTYRPKASATDDLTKWVSLLDGPVPVVSLAETWESLYVVRSLGLTSLITGEWAEYLYDMPQRTLAYLIRRARWRAARRLWVAERRRDVSTSTLITRVAKDLAPFWLRKARAIRRMGTSTPVWIDRGQLVFHPHLPVTEQWRSNQAAMVGGPSLGLEADHVVQMEAGIGIRRPFADVDLVEFFLRLPAEVKYPGPGRKPLIRALMRDRVPSPILDRTDKTFFDAAVLAGIDYECLNSLLAEDEIVDGVDYRSLRRRLAHRELNLIEYMWAKDLAAVHAFVSHAAAK